MQFLYVREEIMKQEKKEAAMKKVYQYTFLERFGQTGEYLKLELKSIFRNKAIRSRVITSIAIISVLSLIISFTEIYDSKIMLNFWCFYCFGLYGLMTLVKAFAQTDYKLKIIGFSNDGYEDELKAYLEGKEHHPCSCGGIAYQSPEG